MQNLLEKATNNIENAEVDKLENKIELDLEKDMEKSSYNKNNYDESVKKNNKKRVKNPDESIRIKNSENYNGLNIHHFNLKR